MSKYKIIQERDKCIGCGACANVCDNWEMKEDGKSTPKKTELDDIGCNRDAADACPVQCIKIEEEITDDEETKREEE
ncbi:ferredoxin [Candidatus Woesearchaeota archaeon]|nr:ferredoxin [Candidatus Woesearchaeota archaeon]